jgi:uncharacterized protein YndB with AHSA1/START domain
LIKMKIRTTATINAEPDSVWPLLTNSEMTAPGRFCLGVPKPVECRLPDAKGGVGQRRQCVSDRGVVNQEITTWIPPTKLEFRMIETNHDWADCVESIEERFDLSPLSPGTKIRRTTTLKASGHLRWLKEAMFYFGLKRVHFFVFKNWKSQV